MIIDRVTITGADDSVEPAKLVGISQRFPFVEWGILLSESNTGARRFPSFEWQRSFAAAACDNHLNVSAHVCGKWVRDICLGHWHLLSTKAASTMVVAKRVQLNFHAITHTIVHDTFVSGAAVVSRKMRPYQLIFQLDDINNALLNVARGAGLNAVPLFDTSGGIGQLPESWPAARDCYCGYAGGLSPENIKEQLTQIAQVTGAHPIWIDVETRVRTPDNAALDLDRVEAFLVATEQWIAAHTNK